MTTVTVDEKASAGAAPYVSFLTLTNLLEWLSAVGLPLQMDRSFWGQKFSGAVGAQLMTALRFLGLLQEDLPTPMLAKLVDGDTDERKRLLADVIREKYATIFALGDFQRVTPKQVVDTLEREYKVSGDTARKAQSFFINACKYAEIPLSSTLRKTARIRKSGKRRQKPEDQGDAGAAGAEDAPDPGDHQPFGYSEKIDLPNGAGTIKLTVAFNPFKLPQADRSLVLRLIDQFVTYADKGAGAIKPANDSGEAATLESPVDQPEASNE